MSGKTDYQAELERIETTIAELGDSALVAPTDTDKVTRYVHGVYQHAVLTGNPVALEKTEPLIDKAIRLIPRPGDLYFLKANLAFKLHRLADARRNLEAFPSVAQSPEGQAMLADLDFQEGRYADARRCYERIIDDNRTWDNLARLAHFEFKIGDAEKADRLYAEAEDELTAKEMRSYSWLELQRGLIDIAHGRHDEAGEHYDRAERAYSGHWLVAEHKAELLGAQGRYDDAAARYEVVLAEVAKPELQQALGELYTRIGRRHLAQPWLDRAHAAYLDSARNGGVHYYHHLADFCADVLKDGTEAVRWARKDIALRSNFATQAALAWALFRDGQFFAALDSMNDALGSGATGAHLFAQAAAISRAAGRDDDGERYLCMARGINPLHGSFHVHR